MLFNRITILSTILILFTQSLIALTVTYPSVEPKEQIVQQLIHETEVEYGSFYAAWRKTLKGEDPLKHILQKVTDCTAATCEWQRFGNCAGEAFALQQRLYQNPDRDLIQLSYVDNLAFAALQVMTSELGASLETIKRQSPEQAPTIDTSIAQLEQLLREDYVKHHVPGIHLVKNVKSSIDLANGFTAAEKFMKEALTDVAPNGQELTVHVNIKSGTNVRHTMLALISEKDFILFDSNAPGHVAGILPDRDSLIDYTLRWVNAYYFPQANLSPDQIGTGQLQLVIYAPTMHEEL